MMKHNMTRKLLALFLVLCMTLPQLALAVGTEVSETAAAEQTSEAIPASDVNLYQQVPDENDAEANEEILEYNREFEDNAAFNIRHINGGKYTGAVVKDGVLNLPGLTLSDRFVDTDSPVAADGVFTARFHSNVLIDRIGFALRTKNNGTERMYVLWQGPAVSGPDGWYVFGPTPGTSAQLIIDTAGKSQGAAGWYTLTIHYQGNKVYLIVEEEQTGTVMRGECTFEGAYTGEGQLGIVNWGGAKNIQVDYMRWRPYEAPAMPESVAVTVDNAAITIGGTAQASAEITPEDADQTLTWSVKAGGEAYASVTADGRVTGLAEGTATLVATASNGATGETTVTVSGHQQFPIHVVGGTADKLEAASGDLVTVTATDALTFDGWTGNVAFAEAAAHKTTFAMPAAAVTVVANYTSAGDTAYYVDPVNGKDAANGTTEATAWKTLDRVNAMTLKPGDSVLLKAGSVFDDQGLALKGGGSVEKPIVVDQYGEGALPIINAGGVPETDCVISGSGDNKLTEHTVSYGIHLKNIDYVTLKNLEITNNPDQRELATGVFVEANGERVMRGIHLDGLYVHNVYGDLKAKAQPNGGIFFKTTVISADQAQAEANTKVATRFDGITVKNCTVKDVSRTAISVGSSHAGYWWGAGECNGVITDEYKTAHGHTNVLIENNYVENAGGDSIVPQFCISPLVQYNISNGASQMSHTDQSQYNAGIWPWRCEDAVFQYNEAYDTVNNGDGQGYDCDFSRGTVYQYNYSHDNEGGFMLVCKEQAFGSVIRYNISQSDRDSIFLMSNPNSAEIYNNTFYIDDDLRCIVDGNGKANLKNNIFYNAGKERSTSAWGSGFTYDNNLYYGFGDLPASEKNAIVGDPLFVNPGAGGTNIVDLGKSTIGKLDCYQLRQGSPAIGAGVVIADNGDKDYAGNPIAATPSIGALESAHTPVAPTGVAITVERNMTVGRLRQAVATVAPAGASQAVTWSIERNEAEAAVTIAGKVSAQKAGTFTLVATALTDNNVVGKVDITVAEAVVVNKNGTDFRDTSRKPVSTQLLSDGPRTVEAWVNIAEYGRSAVLGNFAFPRSEKYEDFSKFNFELTAEGTPRIYWEGGYELAMGADRMKNVDYKSTTKLPLNTWTHVAVTIDEDKGKFTCYVNGEVADTWTTDKPIPSLYPSSEMRVGGDYRANINFKGSMADIRVWADTRTAAEIEGFYSETLTGNEDGLMANWLLDGTSSEEIRYGDNAAKENFLVDYTEDFGWLEGDFAQGDYTVAVLPDTQYMAASAPEAFKNYTKWLADNKETRKIQFAIHLGDMVDNVTSETQWKVARESMATLDNILPYSFAPGNHDRPSGSTDTTQYNKFFPYSKYSEMTGFGNSYPAENMDNSYYTFTAGGTEYLVLMLNFGPSDAELVWAKGILEENPDKKVIIATHSYLHHNGKRSDPTCMGYPSGYNPTFNNGADIWNKLASQYENIFLVLSGHVGNDNIVVRQDTGVKGNVVTQMLSDGQYMKADLGMVMLLTFKNGSNDFEVNWYSITKEKFYKEINQFAVETQTPPVANSVELSQYTANLYSNADPRKVQLTATVLPQNVSDKSVVWSTGNIAVATVDENGLVTAVANGTTAITATAAATGGAAICQVEVTSYVPPYVPPTNGSSTITETVKNEDGSTTTTKTDKKTGTVTETTKHPDGKLVEKVTQKDGSFTQSVTEPDGKKIATVATVAGDKSVAVTGKDGKKVAELNIPTKIPTPEKPFADVSETHWYKGAADFVAGMGIFTEITADTFSGEAFMTRGMLTTVLHRLSGKLPGGENSFSDVDGNAWYAESVAWAASNDIVTGNGAAFDPDGNITRESLSVMLYRYAGLLGVDTTADGMAISEFTDGANVSAWAVDAMSWAVSAGLIQGGDGKLNPNSSATRAEVAAILQRFISNAL